MRTSAGWSEVATTTTERSSASPRSRSMNSRTSRPRSPTSAITLIEALVERAIMPSSVDLPTPEPAKIPRRWPRPQGTSPSSARTPRPTRSLDARPAAARSAARRWSSARRPASGRSPSSSGAPARRGPARAGLADSDAKGGAGAPTPSCRDRCRAALRVASAGYVLRGSRPPRPGPEPARPRGRDRCRPGTPLRPRPAGPWPR